MEVHPFNQLARIIVLDENVTPKEYCLSTDKYDIGRSPLCQIIIDRSTVSRLHARIERDGPRYILRDLNSRNGTFVNNHRLAKNDPFTLSNCDYIGLGGAGATVTIEPTRDRGYKLRLLNSPDILS